MARDTAAGEVRTIRKGIPITGLGYIGFTLAKSAKLVTTVHVYEIDIEIYIYMTAV